MNQRFVITDLAAGGDGVAEVNGKKIFVPFAAVGDVVDAVGNIVELSPSRAKPVCKHYGECGGCRLQHLSDADYQNFKARIAKRAAEHAGFADVEIKPVYSCQFDSRRRVEFSLQKSSGGLSLSFKAAASHRNVVIDDCPVLCFELQELMPKISAAFVDFKGGVDFDSLHLTKAANGIDAVISCKTAPSAKMLSVLAEMAKNIGLASLSYSLPQGGVTVIAEFSVVDVNVGGYMVNLPPAAFLQASEEAQTVITADVVAALAGHKNIADLFSGIGTYAIPLAGCGASVEAYEGDAEMVAALNRFANRHPDESRDPEKEGWIPASVGMTNKVRKLKINATKRDLFAYPLNQAELKKFDAVVINPPRAGAKSQATQLAKAKNVKTIVMVSCNPFSFANDAKILKQGGFMMKNLLPVDQFIWSPHLELVAVLHRA